MEFCFVELKGEILGKTLEVAADGLIESFSRHTIELRQIEIEHDLLATDQVDSPFDHLHGDWQPLSGCFFVGHGERRV